MVKSSLSSLSRKNFFKKVFFFLKLKILSNSRERKVAKNFLEMNKKKLKNMKSQHFK